jgi:hypothetical protein
MCIWNIRIFNVFSQKLFKNLNFSENNISKWPDVLSYADIV